METVPHTPRMLTAAEARKRIRTGGIAAPTAGMAAGFVQANIVILPERHAFDFARFCQANPRPCPLLAMGEPGDPRLPRRGCPLRSPTTRATC